MERIIGNPDYVKRTEDLARNVLHDIGELEHVRRYQCCWGTQFDPTRDMSDIPQGMRIAMMYIEFDYPESDRAPACLIPLVDFATGSVHQDPIIAARIRYHVENYLKFIGREPGRGRPEQMRLNEEYYS